MEPNQGLEGVIPALASPMTADAADIDEVALEGLVERLIAARCGGLLTCGTTGEVATLTPLERRRITEIVVRVAAGRLPVIAQTGALSTHEAVELSAHAEGAGADVVMVLPPFYEAPSWPELVAHYRAIAGAIRIPIMIYNLPMATGMEMTPSQILELTEIERVKYVKDSTGNAVGLTELIQTGSSRIGILNGWDSLTLYGFLAGTRASVWGAASFIPELCVDLFDAAVIEADLARSREVWARIWPICHFLETEGYVAGTKAGSELRGHPIGPPRLPLKPLNVDARGRLASLMERAGITTLKPSAR